MTCVLQVRDIYNSEQQVLEGLEQHGLKQSFMNFLFSADITVS